MSKISRSDERLIRLSVLLEQQGVLRLRDAAEQLGVSEMTIRRDLAAVGAGTANDVTSHRGRLNCLGGFIFAVPDSNTTSDYSFDQEKDSHALAKAQACARAAALIEPQDTIFIDCGTTTPHLATLIPQDQSITVVCYSMNIAEILAHRQDVRLIVLGGVYHHAAASFSGEEGIETLKRLTINKAFISAGGVHDTHGVTCSHFHEVPFKQIAIARALEAHLIVDSSKIGKVRSALFAQTSQFKSVISEHEDCYSH